MNDALAGADGEGMGRDGHVLCLLQGLGLDKGPSRVADGGDDGVVGKVAGLEGNVEDYGIIGQLVEVGDGGQEDRGGRGDGDELAGADRGEDGEQRVSIVADREDLGVRISNEY